MKPPAPQLSVGASRGLRRHAVEGSCGSGHSDVNSAGSIIKRLAYALDRSSRARSGCRLDDRDATRTGRSTRSADRQHPLRTRHQTERRLDFLDQLVDALDHLAVQAASAKTRRVLHGLAVFQRQHDPRLIAIAGDNVQLDNPKQIS